MTDRGHIAQLKDELSGMRDKLEQRDGLIATLARLLREREWTPDEVLPDPSDGDVRCVSCNAVGANNTGAHTPGCELAAALAEAEGIAR